MRIVKYLQLFLEGYTYLYKQILSNRVDLVPSFFAEMIYSQQNGNPPWNQYFPDFALQISWDLYAIFQREGIHMQIRSPSAALKYTKNLDWELRQCYFLRTNFTIGINFSTLVSQTLQLCLYLVEYLTHWTTYLRRKQALLQPYNTHRLLLFYFFLTR